METLAAIGLASNILQFAEFAHKLLSTGNELYESASGTSSKTLELEKIYGSLSNFSLNLEKSNAAQDFANLLTPRDTEEYLPELHDFTLRSLARDCKSVCDELLQLLNRLKVSDGRWRAYKSFKVAIMTLHESKRIAGMEERIARFQQTIASHFLPILTTQQSALMGAVTNLRTESHQLSVDQSQKLLQVSKQLSKIESALSRQQAVDEELPFVMASEASEDDTRTAAKVQVLTKSMVALSITQRVMRDIAREQEFLSSLTFPSRPVRHERIPLAHRKTFQWALNIEMPSLDSPKVPQEESDADKTLLASWLRHGNGIFWVSGKPGSGKSTLMKYVADHEKTENMLQQWAHPKRIVIASHYFWSAGTPMQRSELGLLRTLLFEVFRACPDLIPAVCAERWAATGTMSFKSLTDWTSHELLGILRSIANNTNLETRHCFFIDGVDEFEGNFHDLSATLKSLAQSENFKLCLSSRPINVLRDSFGQDSDQMLYIHELTKKDIQEFTTNRLKDHPRWKTGRFSPDDKIAIINEITESAEGVFLWVFLVTNSLIDGLSNGDTRRDLQNRLESLPKDLNGFFKHMLDSIDPIYTEKMAHTLRVSTNAHEPLHYLIFDMIDSVHDGHVAEALGYDLGDFYNIGGSSYGGDIHDIDVTGPLQLEEIAQEDCKRRINARCGGLIDVSSSGVVEFLHRTVRDFLVLRDMSDYLESKSASMFNPNIATLRSYISVLQSGLTPFGWRFWGVQEVFRQALGYANAALQEDFDTAFEELEFLGVWAQTQSAGTIWKEKEMTRPDDFFRREVLKAGIEKFVCRKLEQSPLYFDSLHFSPLSVILEEANLTHQHVSIMASLIRANKSLRIHDDRYVIMRLEEFFSYMFLNHVVKSEVVQTQEDTDKDEMDSGTEMTIMSIDELFKPNKSQSSASRLPERFFSHPETSANAILASLLEEKQVVPVDANLETQKLAMIAL
ncbi:hypothetical protein G7054_g10781 [Neopestalotiopsis clavispora]|nr:hypothetical protein G7054_g10781 [Neopestalotiopsis clavispora]